MTRQQIGVPTTTDEKSTIRRAYNAYVQKKGFFNGENRKHTFGRFCTECLLAGAERWLKNARK